MHSVCFKTGLNVYVDKMRSPRFITKLSSGLLMFSFQSCGVCMAAALCTVINNPPAFLKISTTI
jgi:hypothetical protein